MKTSFKQFLCEKSNMENNISNWTYHYIEILIKAMWAINRENKNYRIGQKINNTYYVRYVCGIQNFNGLKEQQALEVVLKYIWEQEK